MDALFDKLPYEKLETVPVLHLMAGGFLGGALIFALLFFTLFTSIGEDQTALEGKKTQAENKLKEYEGLLADQGRVKRELVSKKGELVQYKNQMPSQNQLHDFMNQMAEIGSALNINVGLMKLQKPKENDFYMEFPIEMMVSGGFYKTTGYLAAVQNLLNMTHFSTYSLEMKSEKEKGVLVTNSLAKAFTFIEGAEEREKRNPKEEKK